VRCRLAVTEMEEDMLEWSPHCLAGEEEDDAVREAQLKGDQCIYKSIIPRLEGETKAI
jgi:hypothetical protein